SLYVVFLFFFFFSSRRRHTRSKRDWSSDVCSSDLAARCNVKIERISNPFPEFQVPKGYDSASYFEKVVREGFAARVPHLERLARSEERRVGKECRCRWSRD